MVFTINDAATEAYFDVQTRRIELHDERTEQEKRLDLRSKVSQSVKRLSDIAHDAGVRNHRQGIFHGQRYLGLYGMSLTELKSLRGLPAKDHLLDRAGILELSANDFQMNLAADVISKDRIKSEQRAISTNLEVARRVRSIMLNAGAGAPEHMPLEQPIKEIKRRVKNQKTLPQISTLSSAREIRRLH